VSLFLVGPVLVLGGLLVFLAALGVYRMPDVYTKCHTSSKASTLGKILVFSALGMYFFSWDTAIKSVLIVIFFFFTVPVGTHLIARASHKAGATKYKTTLFDDME